MGNRLNLPEGTETILIVDDQETVWDFLIEALQKLGYSVLLAENGLDAVEIYENNPGQIDLVLLDMIMPHQGGHTTFYKLKELDPGVCVLLSSGFVSHNEVDDLLANGAAGFLPKPHRIATMATEIRRILDERKKSQPVPKEKSGKNLENPA
ncbi:MAG: response regulator [Victivallales bacterium]|nr:response regulator [bacterium]MDY5695973.1 response regulator [Victivallales bacterium]